MLTSRWRRTCLAGFQDGSNDVEESGIGEQNVNVSDPVGGIELVDGDEGVGVRGGVNLHYDELAVFADGDSAEGFGCGWNVADCGNDGGGRAGHEDFKYSWLSCS